MGWEHRPPSEIQMGNGTLLATFDAMGEIEQLFAPHLDALQSSLGSFQTAVVIPNSSGEGVQELIPIRPEQFHVVIELETGSQVLKIEYQHRHGPMRLERKIALHPSDSLLVDQWTVRHARAGLLHLSIPWVGNATSGHCSMYHPQFHGIVHHRGRRWLGVIARGSTQWVRVGHLGDGDRNRLWSGDQFPLFLNTGDLHSYGRAEVDSNWNQVVQGCATWGALAVEPSEKFEFWVICAESEQHLGKNLEQLRHLPTERFLKMIQAMVVRRHAPAEGLIAQVSNKSVQEMCRRSIDVLHSLQDAQSGALMAAAEVDPHSRLSGGYGFSWPRDGAYLGAALGAFEYRDRVEHYFRFVKETQDISGAWWQRYLATGHAGPSWGRIQIDEPASVLSLAYLHFRRTRDHLWLTHQWPMIKKGLAFLENFISKQPALGQPSHDLWEERMGFHAYSLGAVAKAFTTGAYLAGEMEETEAQSWYLEMGNALTHRVLQTYSPEPGVLFRTLYPDHRDATMDASLLGWIVPFGIVSRRSPLATWIADQVWEKLWWTPTGGVLRYNGDHYRGGNPWVLTTLWLALVEINLGRTSQARHAFEWAHSKATSLGMLPEQVHKESGRPFWVIPLGWSHAMYLLFVREVLERGAGKEIWGGQTEG